MVLPAGTTIPPLPYLLGVLGGAIAVALALRERDVTVDTRTVLAFAPWMVAGSALYVLYQVGGVPAVLRPLFGSPTVYATTAVLAGATWTVAARFEATERLLAGIGVVVAAVPVGLATGRAVAAGTFSPGWSLLGLGIAAVVAGALWWGVGQFQPEIRASLGAAGALAVFAHVLDGVSTSIGVDVLQFGEKTPLSAFILEVGAALPTAPYLGSGWVFVVVKAGVALGLLWLIAGTVEEDPRFGNGLLLLVTAVGLGPAVHNLLLFAVAGPAGV